MTVLAGPGIRTVAFLIDAAAALIFGFFSLAATLVVIGPDSLWSIIVFFVLLLGFIAWNYGHREGMTGQSVGKSIMRIRVVRDDGVQPIGMGFSLLRFVLLQVLNQFCYIAGIWVFIDEQNRGLHDLIVNSKVISER